MKTKRELQINAKQLIEDCLPEQAMDICKQLWSDFPEKTQDEFNLYDAQLTLKATRDNDKIDFNFIYQVVKRFQENDKVKTDFGWFVFNNYLKGVTTENFIHNETVILKTFDIIEQQDLSNFGNICPFTIACIGLAKAHSKNLFNANRIESLLKLLKVEFLSKKSSSYRNSDSKEVHQPSDFETYYALRTKALLKNESYSECIDLCQIALREISDFHYNNDLWFKMRIAICQENLGEYEKSERLFQELLSTRAGSDKWFLYRDIAELYFEQKKYDNAWRFAVDAAFYGNEPHYMINLYVLQARILVRLERASEGKVLAQLIAAVLQEQGWSNKERYKRILEYYKIDITQTNKVKSVFREAKTFWSKERYMGMEELQGLIVFIHPNGKVGKIKTSDDSTYNFHKRDFNLKQRNLRELNKAKVTFVKMYSYDGEEIAENIKVIAKVELTMSTSDLEGKEFLGSVKNVADFGVFVRLDGLKDGLLHRSALPKSIQNNLNEHFKSGNKIKVRVSKVTDKGLQLKLIE